MNDKRLLKTELARRLPHGLIVRETTYEKDGDGKENETYEDVELTYENIYEYASYNIEVKPYLRKMSDITDKERKLLNSTFDRYIGDLSDRPTYETFDFLDEHMLDYRGLIDKGIALEAKEGTYKFE